MKDYPPFEWTTDPLAERKKNTPVNKWGALFEECHALMEALIWREGGVTDAQLRCRLDATEALLLLILKPSPDRLMETLSGLCADHSDPMEAHVCWQEFWREVYGFTLRDPYYYAQSLQGRFPERARKQHAAIDQEANGYLTLSCRHCDKHLRVFMEGDYRTMRLRYAFETFKREPCVPVQHKFVWKRETPWGDPLEGGPRSFRGGSYHGACRACGLVAVFYKDRDTEPTEAEMRARMGERGEAFPYCQDRQRANIEQRINRQMVSQQYEKDTRAIRREVIGDPDRNLGAEDPWRG